MTPEWLQELVDADKMVSVGPGHWMHPWELTLNIHPSTWERLHTDRESPEVKWRVVLTKQHLYRGWAIFRAGNRMWSKPTLPEALAYIRRNK